MVCDAIELELNQRCESIVPKGTDEIAYESINAAVRATTKAYKEMLLTVLFKEEGEK